MPSASAGQAQLVARAQHPVADDAHLLGPLDPPVAGQDGAGQGDRDALAGRDVRRAADDLERLAGPRRSRASATAGRPADASRPPAARRRRRCCQSAPQRSMPLTSIPSSVSRSASCSGRQVDVDVLAQPGERHSHRNCSRKRRSFSMYSRRSPTPWRRLAMPLDAHPEGEALVALRVEPAVLEHDRVDHAGAEDRHPAGPRAGRAARRRRRRGTRRRTPPTAR